jgi:hypothetical protein
MSGVRNTGPVFRNTTPRVRKMKLGVGKMTSGARNTRVRYRSKEHKGHASGTRVQTIMNTRSGVTTMRSRVRNTRAMSLEQEARGQENEVRNHDS